MKKLFLLLTAIVTLAMSAMAQNRTYTGTVLSSADNEPLIGATVTPIGGGHATMTDVNGQFTLSVPASVKEVKVTYVGMSPKTVDLKDGMKIFLDNSATVLDQIVVTGYGSGKKLGSVVGSVAVVDNEVLENTPATTFVDALQGQVAGLAIFSNSGDPSSVENDVMIRGVNSLNASTQPLYIMDGAPISQNVFTTLNPTDIENITVLKDAASVAIYGSRAANGVIVITTKKGKYGENARVTVRANVGWGTKLPSHLEMMDSKQLLQFGEMVGQPFSQEIYDLVNNYGINTDWRKELYHTALTYSLEAAVQGGSDRSSYFLSLNHYDQDGVIAQSGMHRETLRFSLDTKVNNWFRVGIQSNLGYTKYETNGYAQDIYGGGSGNNLNNPAMMQYYACPWDSPYYYTFNDKGDIIYGDKAEYLHYTGMMKPEYLASFADYYRNKVTVNAGIYEQLNPIKGLTLRAQQSVDAYETRLYNRANPRLVKLSPMGDVYPLQRKPDNTYYEPGEYIDGLSQQSMSRYYSFTYTNTAEYRFNIAEKNHFAVLLGQEAIISKSHGFGVFSEGFKDRRKMLLSQGTSVEIGNLSESSSKSVMNSYFGNLTYDFDNKYFVEASIRRDGSSKFAPGHRWGTFYAVGGKWVAKKESFLQPLTWLTDLSLRANYGEIGNSGISNYLYFDALGNSAMYGPDDVTGNLVSNPGSPRLTWETTKSFDLGLNFRLFDRVTTDIDFYKKKTVDMLMSIPWSYTTGFGSNWNNAGAMTNTGVEVDVKADLFKNKNWYVGARVNFAYNKNEITELFDGMDAYTVPNTGVRYEIGKSSTDYYYAQYLGVDPRDGKQMWLSPTGNVTKQFNEEELAQFLGKNFVAPWNGGFGVDVRWKGLSARADFSWSAEKYLMNNDLRYVRAVDLFLQGMNQTTDMLNMWMKPGDITNIPAASEEIQFDSRFIEDASFMRLKNLTVAYSLPKSLLDKMYLKGLTFHFTGRNLWTLTGFTGEDPEPSGNLIRFFYPNTRQFEFGFEVSF